MKLYQLGGTLKHDGVKYTKGSFVELQAEDRNAERYITPRDLQSLITDGVLVECEDDAGPDKLRERCTFLWTDLKAVIESDGQLEALNELKRVLDEFVLPEKCITSLVKGIRDSKELRDAIKKQMLPLVVAAKTDVEVEE